jgi:hypothetical protein
MLCMAGSGLRSRDKQRLRAEARAAVAGHRSEYVLEAIAERLGIVNGRFEVRLRDGFMVSCGTTKRFSREDLEIPIVWPEHDGEGMAEKEDADRAGRGS